MQYAVAGGKFMFVPLKEASSELSVSERFLRELVAKKKIPFYRLSPRTIRLDLDELRKYMRLVAEGDRKRPSHE